MGYYSSPRIKKIRNESQTANNTSILPLPMRSGEKMQIAIKPKAA